MHHSTVEQRVFVTESKTLTLESRTKAEQQSNGGAEGSWERTHDTADNLGRVTHAPGSVAAKGRLAEACLRSASCRKVLLQFVERLEPLALALVWVGLFHATHLHPAILSVQNPCAKAFWIN
jgi:hypothetical protein